MTYQEDSAEIDNVFDNIEAELEATKEAIKDITSLLQVKQEPSYVAELRWELEQATSALNYLELLIEETVPEDFAS